MGKIKKIPLHIQIIAALVLGAAFGSIFPVDRQAVTVTYSRDNEVFKKEVAGWEKITVLYTGKAEDTAKTAIEFTKSQKADLIKLAKSLSANQRKSLEIEIDSRAGDRIENIKSIEKQSTIATLIRPAGDLFINLLSFMAIPLVIASLIVGAASLGDIKKLGRIGGKTFAIYVVTTALAITIGLSVANIFEPGKKVDSESKEKIMSEFQSETSEKITEEIKIDIVDFFVSIVPKNPVKAMAEGNMLQIVFFAVLFGIMMTFIGKERADSLNNFFSGVSDTMIKMVDVIMLIAPFGVFALISSTIAEFGFEIITTIIWYIISVLLGLTLHTVIVYSLLVKSFGKMSPMFFFKGMRNAQAIAFSTSSSAATLPVTFECVEENLKVPKQISGFVLPLGATINMDGTALYQGVATVFIAQVYGMDLDLTQQLTIVLTAVLASIGTAPVPGVGIIMLIMILQSVNVPAEGIALIIGVDRILDMCRTITNITGDAACSVAVAGTEKVLGK